MRSAAPVRGADASARVPWWHTVPSGAALLLVGAIVYLVGRDGSPGWRAARVSGVLAATAVGVELWRRRGTRSVAIPGAVVLGLVGIVVGVGIGLPHLAKGGPGVVAVTGLVALVAGLVLYVTAGARLVRGRGRAVRAGVPVGLVVVAALALLTLGQAIAVTNVPRTEVGRPSPADRGLAHRSVRIPAADGPVLAGWFVPGVNGAAVVLRHGAGSTRSSVVEEAAVLARHGYSVLLMDARGHGESTGRAMDFGWFGDADIRAGIDFVVGQPEVTGAVGVLGMSMGGEEAVGAAAADDRIAAVVAEGASGRVAADKRWMRDAYGWQGRAQQWVDVVTYGAVDLLTAADPPITLRAAVAAAAPRPVLLIAAGEDPDEADAASWIAGGAPTSVTVWVVPGAGHTAGLATRPEEWERRVVAFLDVHLLGR